MKLISTIAASFITIPILFPSYLNAQEFEDFKTCTLPDFYRFQAKEANAIAMTHFQSTYYLYVYVSGVTPSTGNPSSFPLVYRVRNGSCYLVYDNQSGHDTPLDYSLPKAVATDLNRQVKEYFSSKEP